MIVFRIARVIVHLLYGLILCALVFPFAGSAQRNAVIRRWSVGLLTMCNVTVSLRDAAGTPLTTLPNTHALIVSNHISWLDIFAINAARPCHFVAKADIRNWPLVGWLCARGGTIFIARGQKSALRDAYRHIVQSLRAGERIAFFPEGTTAAQADLLPFHSNLFECAIEAGVSVQPYALRYLTAAGKLDANVEFVGDTTFVQSMVRILRAERIVAEVTVLPTLSTQHQDRRALADQAQQGIAAALKNASQATDVKHPVRFPDAASATAGLYQPAPPSEPSALKSVAPNVDRPEHKTAG